MITIRKMLETDVPAVAEIDRQTSIEPWTEKLFCDCIRVGYSCWVLANDNEIIGFGLLSCAAGEAHILHLIIENKWRRQGLGKSMMQHLIQMARLLSADIVYLEVRGSNAIARNLYKSLNFIEIGLRKDYYPDVDNCREDAITLALKL